MDYRRADDELFGKYCYIDTPWIAGEKTIYRIIRSGVRSNTWCEVPIKFRDEPVTHNHSEDIVFAVLDTLIDENTKIKRFALKDVEIIEVADRPQVEEEPVMTREDAIYWIKNLAVLSTEKQIPQIEEALSMAVEALQDEVWKDEP